MCNDIAYIVIRVCNPENWIKRIHNLHILLHFALIESGANCRIRQLDPLMAFYEKITALLKDRA